MRSELKHALSFACLLLVAAPHGGPARAAPPRADWTFMVFMNAKNNLEEAALGNFLQMAEVESSARVNVLVQLGRPKQHYSDGYGPWAGTRIFRITRNLDPSAAPVHDLLDVDMGSGKAVAEFVGWCRERYPAKHYALVIWDHGEGWRFQYANTFLARLQGARGLTLPRGAPAPLARSGFKSVSHDEETGHVIYNRDLADSLKSLLGKERLDVISFDACLMGMIETAYAMREVADFMVASEELEPGAGWNYSRVLGRLVPSPGIDGRELARRIVDAYSEEYGDVRLTALSAVSLLEAEPTADAISRLGEAAEKALNQKRGALESARRRCRPYGAAVQLTNSVDIACIVDGMLASKELGALHAEAREVRSALGKMVVLNYVSKRMAKEGPGGAGLAIYFPPSAHAYLGDPDHDGYEETPARYAVEFVERKSWARFIRKYVAP